MKDDNDISNPLISGEAAAAVRGTAAFLTHIEDYSVKSTNSNILKPRLNESCNVSSSIVVLILQVFCSFIIRKVNIADAHLCT